MSKILLPTPDAPPNRGGVARYIASLLAARPEVDIDVLPENQGTLWILRHVWKRGREFEEIWTHHLVPVGTACWLLSFFQKKSYVVFLHGLDFDLVCRNAWKRFLARRILLRARRIVTNSYGLQKEVSAFLRCDDVCVVHPCVSNELVRASETTRRGLKRYTPEELAKMLATTLVGASGIGVSISQKSEASEMIRLLTVARLVERKGHRKVLEAMKEIPNASYTVVGDGPLRTSLEEVVREWGLSDRVTFLTHVADGELPEVYASHDIFVMPTTKSERDREGFGIVYAEAGLFGLPCIATDIPGVDEVITRDVTGLLIADTSEALREGIEKLARSPGMRSRMGSAARARVLERFTEKQFTKQLQGLV